MLHRPACLTTRTKALRFYAAATQKFKLAQTGPGIALASTFNSLREYFSPATDFYTTF